MSLWKKISLGVLIFIVLLLGERRVSGRDDDGAASGI
ncbi:Uncharacterised protein [Salmonella enterica subsp. arizonae]|uniref:Uncharacterized protein n=1 Tax=Salmonella enterica subsp. arizonae TaxID=59203 RepID=A0A379TGY9_SALER|nr:Uncharacterised protein [Salmonella enterica subsp. arizonae]